MRTGKISLVVAAALVTATPASAFDKHVLGYGSLFLTDFSTLIDKSPKLKAEINDALEKAGKKLDEQMCEAPRFPGPWKHLHGAYMAPYVCNIGDKWLEISATVKVTGRNGKVFETQSPEAMKQARDIRETQPTRQWTQDDPRKRK